MPTATVGYRRALAPSEKLFADITMAYSVVGTGHIDIAALTSAFAALRQTYPVLACRIIETGQDAFDLVLPPPQPATIRTSANSVDEPLTGNDALVAEDEVCAVDIAQQGNNFRLTLLTQHSVADGMASLHYLEVLCAQRNGIG